MLHKRNKSNNYKIFRNTCHLLFKNSLSLLLGQGILYGISVFMLIPTIQFLFRIALTVTGYSYITRNNIGMFLVQPITVLVILILFVILGIYLLYEVSYLTAYFSYIENGETPRQFRVIIWSFKRLAEILMKRNFKIIPMTWIMVFVSNLPLIFFFFKRSRLFRFFAERSFKNPAVIILLICLTVLLTWFVLKRLFVIHYCLAENLSYQEACKKSILLKRGKVLRTFLYLAGWNVMVGAAVLAIYILTMAIIALCVSIIQDYNLAIATFLSINDRVNGFLTIGIFAVCTIADYALYTHLFYQYKLEQDETLFINHTTDNITVNVGYYKRTVQVTFIVLILINIYYFYDIVKNGSPMDYMNLDAIKVTSHRGFSYDVPENTLPAIEKAINEQADYVEMDVRETKDGELVLLHDASLKRTTGLNKSIWDVNYGEVALLDAGSWVGEEFKGTRIPTLREALELCKGKINVNIDLKYRTSSRDITEKVVNLIKEYDMELQCVITSTSLTALESIKKQDPDIHTGYITYQIFSSYYRSESIDFFSVRSNLVSKTLVEEVHKHGKEMHVWTVNSKSELERMKMIGVDNVITNNPAYAKGILYSEESNRLFITLLKIMME